MDGEHTRQLGSLNISGSKHSGYEELIKKLVRLAFATEFRRVPLRRSEISAKVIEHSGIPFKHVFEGAQAVLGKTFGMRLMELPGKDKVTVAQRRQAQKAPTTSSSGVKSYLLVSILPRALQAHTAIMTPARIPTESEEAVYVGIHSTVVSIIALSGGSVSEQRLERYLKRLQIESKTPADRTERLMQRMCKDGYLIRHRDTSSGEEMVEYSIGARAKVEIGKAGVEGLVRTVYGEAATTELNNKLKRSLQLLGDLYPPPHEITPASNERCNRNADDMRDESD